MEDRCIMCGCIIPEGRMVCPVCSGEVEERNRETEELEKILFSSKRDKLYHRREGLWIGEIIKKGKRKEGICNEEIHGTLPILRGEGSRR